MSIREQLAKELTAFPAPLRELVKAELKAGNSIVEVSSSFPAPPAGAYVKLARAVTTRPRASSEGIDFYDRNNSSYAGEFADASRFYFVLEPPNPPPPYPDMDAIRQAADGEPDALTQFARTREAGSGLGIDAGSLRAVEPVDDPHDAPARALTVTETPTGARRLLHFRDRRPPQEIQFALERDLMTLFTTTMNDGRLTMTAKAKLVGAPYEIELCFEAALLLTNCYSLSVATSWREHDATHHDYYRKTAGSWFGFWTRDFKPANPPAADEGSAERYQKLCEAALHAETHLDTVQALQQAIVAGLKRGASFATAHKEGGTNISWANGRFIRSDYGDDPGAKIFSSEAEFLTALRQFYDWETSKNTYPDKVPDIEAWRLILRLLRTS